MNRTQVLHAILDHYKRINGNQQYLLVQDALVRLGDLELMSILHELTNQDLSKTVQFGVAK